MKAKFFEEWPAEDYPQAVSDCKADLRRYLPKCNQDPSYRRLAKNAIEQARYLGLHQPKQMRLL